MTLIAGFVCSDGLLVCADTLYTDGQTKEYRDKLFPWGGHHAGMCVAVSGNSDNARAAFDACVDRLSAKAGKNPSNAKIIQIIKPIIGNAFKTSVEKHQTEDARNSAYFELLLAIATKDDEPALYVAAGFSFAKVDTFECLGVGRQLARHVIEPAYDKDRTVNETAVLAIQALVAAKERVADVGGPSEFLVIRDKQLSAIVPHHLDRSEPLVLEYQRQTANLLIDLADQELTDDEIRGRLSRFVEFAQRTRSAWIAQAAPLRELIASLSRRPTSSSTDQT